MRATSAQVQPEYGRSGVKLGRDAVYLAVISALGFLLFFSSYLGAMEITDGGSPTAPRWSTILSVTGALVALLGFVGAVVAFIRSSTH